MKPKILVVDDEELVRRMLRQSLTARGYDVSTAQDGREALQLVQREAFDLIICDIVMPETDGLEVIISLRKSNTDLPVIAISAPGNDMFLESAKGLGAIRVFEKPFEICDLVIAIEEVLPRQQA